MHFQPGEGPGIRGLLRDCKIDGSFAALSRTRPNESPQSAPALALAPLLLCQWPLVRDGISPGKGIYLIGPTGDSVVAR